MKKALILIGLLIGCSTTPPPPPPPPSTPDADGVEDRDDRQPGVPVDQAGGSEPAMGKRSLTKFLDPMDHPDKYEDGEEEGDPNEKVCCIFKPMGKWAFKIMSRKDCKRYGHIKKMKYCKKGEDEEDE